MNWNKLLTTKRLGAENWKATAKPEDRSQFQRDYDRIIFSASFRRMQNKTQVFPLPEHIFVHNRLTHSLEVASVGRSLGNRLAEKLTAENPENLLARETGTIVSAACLAHDLGNPPFGHSGESAISNFFLNGAGKEFQNELSPAEWSDFIRFDGNANAFRILTHQFAGKRPGGFALTYPTLASIVKYPYESLLANQQKFGFLLKALSSGAPPHGGMALGFDRLIMMLRGEDSIRNVIAFPKTQKASCVLTDAPSSIDQTQLDELFLKSTIDKEK